MENKRKSSFSSDDFLQKRRSISEYYTVSQQSSDNFGANQPHSPLNNPDKSEAFTRLSLIKLHIQPLEFVEIYVTNSIDCQPHYLYVSQGFSALYENSQVAEKSAFTVDQQSDLNYELTLRLRVDEQDPIKAPIWPVKLMKALAIYSYETGVFLKVGDHVPDVLNLDELDAKKVKHALITNDNGPKPILAQSHDRRVTFLQIVGCTDDELQCVQKWSANRVLRLMEQFDEYWIIINLILGGKNQIIDLNRGKSVFDMDTSLKKTIANAIQKDGSDLGFVKAQCDWQLNSADNGKNALKGEFNSYDHINLTLDINLVHIFKMAIKHRLLKNQSFIFNGPDTRVLVLIPSAKFKNSAMRVSNAQPLMANQTQCQLLLDHEVLHDIYNFLMRKPDVTQSHETMVGRSLKRVTMKITFSSYDEE